MILWSENTAEIKALTRQIRNENIQLHVDVGSLEILERDRSITAFNETLMNKILERKKFSYQLTVRLPAPG
jgi:hypothetical protein